MAPSDWRFAKIEADLAILKWMMAAALIGVTILNGGMIELLIKTFR